MTFDRANLRGSQFRGCSLERCSFERTSKLLRIVDSEVVDCVFRGFLDTLLIDGRGHRDAVSPRAFSADFSAAVLRNSKIEGYVLDRVTWPEQHGQVVVRHYPQVFRAAAEWLGRQAGSDAERQAISILSSTVKAPARKTPTSASTWMATGIRR